MKNVLLITSSPRGEASVSLKLATDLAGKITGAQIKERDLWNHPVPHIDSTWVGAAFTPAEARTPEQVAALSASDELIAELKAADVVIVAAGMINFGVPSTLKSWIDHIARSGITFKYGAAGPEGLITGKKAILVLATGGVYSTGPMSSMNHLEPILRTVLEFIGFTDIETVLAEGIAYGADATEKAIADATAKISTIAPPLSV